MKNNISLLSEMTLKLFLFIKKKKISFLIIGLYLSFVATSFTQVVYSDIIPDAELISYDSIYLDINKDGISDYTLFHKNYVGSQDVYYHFTISSNNGSAVAIMNDSAAALSTNEIINEGLEWSTNNMTYIQYLTVDHYEDSVGNWTDVREGYLGLKLKIANEYHYAWLRIHFSEDLVMWAVDFAFNETPQDAIIAGQELPVFATSVYATDEHDNFDGRDIVVSFTKASDESLFSEYRIIIVKADDLTAEDVMVMSELSEDKYYSININPADIDFTETRSLWETTVDKDGDLIENFANYKAYVLNVSTSGNMVDNQISVASAVFSLHGYIEAVDKPRAFDDGDNNNPSDIKISFNTNIERDYLAEFRAFIIPTTDSVGFNAQTAWSLSSDYYTSIPLDEDTMATVYLNEYQKDIIGNPIAENTDYHIAILSVPDSVNSRISVLSIPSRRFSIMEPNEFLAGQKEGNYIQWFECDSAFAPYPYWNGTNPHHGHEEFYIDMNRDGLVDFELYGNSYSSSGGSVGRYFNLNTLRKNKVLICDHAEHENWIDVLHEKDAIGTAYNWHDSTSILKNYSFGGNSGILRNDGHLGSLYNTKDYYIGFMLMDNGYPQYAWLKMNGVEFLEYAFSDINSGINDFTKEKTFKVFPNPANNIIRIESSIISSTNSISISIINSLGMQVDEFNLRETSVSKNISHYPAGLYFFIIKDKSGVLETHRIKKQPNYCAVITIFLLINSPLSKRICK